MLTDVSSAMISSRLRSMMEDVWGGGEGKEGKERRKLCAVRDQS
jgi:hypothetical protein